MSKTKLTIQINNLEALERLIGGDTEVELDIRNSVVQAFSKKHLKVVAESAVMIELAKSIKLTIQDELFTDTSVRKFQTNLILNDSPFKKAILRAAQEGIDAELREAYVEYSEQLKSEFRKQYSNMISNFNRYLDNHNVNAKLGDIIDKKLKEKFM